MHRGGIFLLRKIRLNPLWQDKPFTQGQAWVDMLLQANHKDADVLYRHDIYHIKRGQFIRTERDLAGDWGWSRSKVTRFLNLLRRCNMIVTETAPKANLITISNYNELQKLRTNNEPIVNQTRTKREPKQECIRMKKNKPLCAYTVDFERFWSAYPRKVNKKKAFDAWKKCNGSRPPIDDLISAIAKQSDTPTWKKDSGQFIPHPTTWINGERWSDQVDVQVSHDDDPPYW